ncbi:hypothetical protein L208DRAFT_1283052 [Tricholoma matsutake]|nr:hypothetical protein L208DRAFT_1283052 [Tricholoma matsutake 945]
MKIHGLEANVLLDSGCTSDSVSPEFTIPANLKVHELEEPMPLQLGMVGTRSKINFGLFVEFELGNLSENHYFNVINIDQYDTIIGTVFMQKHGIVLDFEQDKVWLQGHDLQTIVESASTFQQVCSDDKVSDDWNEYIEEFTQDRYAKEEWLEAGKDILQGVPEQPPPMREINHQIPLVDDHKKYHYYLPKCPDSMQQPLTDKIERYCRMGWWRPAHMVGHG